MLHLYYIYMYTEYTVLEFATFKCPKKDRKPPVYAAANQRNYEGI